MTLKYELTRESTAKGLTRSHAYRAPVRTILLPLLGCIFLAASGKCLLFEESEGWPLGIGLFILGTIYLILPIQRRRKAVANVFAGRAGEIKVELTADEEGITMASSGSSGTSSWSSFVDFKICKEGILLYPQKMLHYWIPNTASVEGGTWQDFESLASGKIQRKI